MRLLYFEADNQFLWLGKYLRCWSTRKLVVLCSDHETEFIEIFQLLATTNIINNINRYPTHRDECQ